MAETRIPLQDAIRALRAEVLLAQQDANSQEIKFGLGPIELELQVVVEKEAGATGELNLGVVSFGGSGGATRADTHRVKLTLTPVTASGEPTVYVGEQVSGRPR